MWGIDLSHTAHTDAQTGIQQVCRSILTGLAREHQCLPLVYDRYWKFWRRPDRRELSNLIPHGDFPAGRKRSGKWTRAQKLRGRINRILQFPGPSLDCELFFCPELFDAHRDEAFFKNPQLRNMLRVAYFYDAIPLQFPQWTPKKTVGRYPGYLRTLARFDHVTCISRASQRDLWKSWETIGIDNIPETSVTPLGLPPARIRSRIVKFPEPVERSAVVLMVGTLEARKNHLALLEACDQLWAEGVPFQLILAGMLNRETGTPAEEKIRQLQQAQRPVSWENCVSDNRLAELYSSADIFVYPSLYEGFGLPVIEALAHGLPVILTDNGALAELVPDGGCMRCHQDVAGIKHALAELLTNEDLRGKLREEASQRPIRTMQDASEDLAHLFQALLDKRNS